MTPARPQFRFALLLIAGICLQVASGCASYRWPRIDPSGQSVLVWPQQPGMPVAAAPGVYAPPSVTFPGPSAGAVSPQSPITATPSTPPPSYPTQPPVQPYQTPPVAPAPFTPPPGASPVPQAATIDIRIVGPDRAAVGTEARFEVQLTNRGTSPITGIVITDTFDQGLEHAISASPIQREMASLAAGETKSFGLSFRVTRPGRLCHVLRVQAGSGVAQSATACVLAEAPVAAIPSARLTITAKPTQAQIGDKVDFAVEVTNTGTQPIPQLTLTDFIDPNLRATDAAQGYRQLPGQLSWQIANLGAGKSVIYRVQCQCIASTSRACVRAELTDGSGIRQTQEACITIQPRDAGAPAGAR